MENGASLDPREPRLATAEGSFGWEQYVEHVARPMELDADPALPQEMVDYEKVEQFGERPELLPDDIREKVEFANDVIVKAKQIFADNLGADENLLADFDVVMQVARDSVVEAYGALED